MSTTVSNDGRPVEGELIVNDKKWVAVVDNVVVNTDTVEVLFQEILEESVFLFESGLLFLDG